MSAHDLSRNIFELQALEVRRLLTTASITPGTNTLRVLGTTSAENITVNRTSGGRITVSGVVDTFAIGNTVGTQVNNILVEASGGSDTIIITNNVRFPSNNLGIPVAIGGGGGNDNITGGPGNDQINGNDGDDTIDGGIGNDLIVGGANLDTANYSFRGTAIKVTLNSANPGLAGEKDGELIIAEQDDVQQTEEVIGGAGNDTLIGSAGQDFLGGGGGNDSLTGNAGNDELIASTGSDKIFGNDGNDYLHAQNSDVDTVNGGTNSDGTADFDAATVDPADTGARLEALLAAATSGSELDPDYGNLGKAKHLIPDDWFSSVVSAIDSQGRVYFASTVQRESQDGTGVGYDFAVARFTPSGGAIDPTYNGFTGEAQIDFTLLDGQGTGSGNAMDFLSGIHIDDQDRVILVGQHYAVNGGSPVFAVARLLPSGQLDTSFNTDAGANGVGRQLIDIQGSIGTGYGDNAVDAAVDSNDAIVIVGNYDDGDGGDFAVARLLDNGEIDSSLNDVGYTTADFGNDGTSSDFVKAVAIQDFGSDDLDSPRIVVGGSSSGLFTVARFNNDGALDDTFGDTGGGWSSDDFGGASNLRDVAVNSLNQIIAVGNVFGLGEVGFSTDPDGPAAVEPGEQDAIVAVYAPGGALSASIAQPATVGDYITYDAVHIDSENRIVVSGEMDEDFVVARYLPTMSFDPSFADGLVTVDFSSDSEFPETDFSIAVRTLPNNKIIASGLNFFGEGSGHLVAARFFGEPDDGETEPPPNGEGEVTDVGFFPDYDDIHQVPPPFPVDEHFTHMSEGAKFYLLSQPDDDGVARLKVPDGPDSIIDNVIKIYDVTTGDGTTDIAVSVDGLVLYFDPESMTRIEIYATDGNDTITVERKLDVLLLIDGGQGNDNITGGTGGEIILGGAGNDTVTSGQGDDVIIGGTGADRLTGSPKEDLLIAGTTAHDSNAAALVAIQQEWAVKSHINSRIDNLRNGGGLNGAVVLRGINFGAGATVFDDNAIDIIDGQGAKDWIFARTSGANKDQILGGVGGKTVDLI